MFPTFVSKFIITSIFQTYDFSRWVERKKSSGKNPTESYLITIKLVRKDHYIQFVTRIHYLSTTGPSIKPEISIKVPRYGTGRSRKQSVQGFSSMTIGAYRSFHKFSFFGSARWEIIFYCFIPKIMSLLFH